MEIMYLERKRMKKFKKLWIILGSILVFFFFLIVCGAMYVNTYYHATDEAKSRLESDDQVTVEKIKGAYIFKPIEYNTGILFYPGGKVEEAAYAPLLHTLASEGILCILCEMPFRLAVFKSEAAKQFYHKYEVEHWYLAGHSLGGSMAASYLAKNVDDYQGLILLASYSTADLSNTDLKVISLYGENDQVLNQKKYLANKKNLPKNTKEYVIAGGCHAYFGKYGKQLKDGEPTITNDEQIEYTVDSICSFLKE